jgi:hypothetical protein
MVWWLRTELWTVPFLRYWAPEPMLTASAGELWPFRLRFARESKNRVSLLFLSLAHSFFEPD